MENRFTLKDLLLSLLIVGLIVVVFVAMKQYDRQWDTLKQVEKQVAQQAASSADMGKEVAAIRKTLAQGVPMTGATVPTTQQTANLPANANYASEQGNPFSYVEKAMESPDYARGDWLIQNFGTKVSKITPLLSTDTYASIIQNRVMDSLGYRDPESLEWCPLLATNWSVSADGLQIRVMLRKGVQYSDGSPFNADDLIFTFDFIRNPDVDAPRQRAAYEPLDKVEKINDFEVLFSFKRPYFESLSLVLGTQPLSKKFYGRFSPQDFNKQVGLLIGTGPYRMVDPESWRPGTPIQLFRNERYWGVPAPFDRIFWREVEEEAASLTMFRNGEIDTFGAQPDQYESLREDPDIQKKANRFEYFFRDGGYTYVAWNQLRVGKPTVFTDKRVRQAMTMLIDRERLVRDIFRGYAKPAVGPFGVVSPQNDPAIKAWPYDVKKAIALLSEAGFVSKNNRGVLCNAQGQELRFKLTYPNKSPIYEQVALAMKDSFARVGVVMEQEPTDWPIMLKKLDSRDFDAISLGWTGGIETDIYQMFHSSQIKEGDNVMSYRSEELDKAIESARTEVDPAKRMPLWHKAHQILHEDQPYTFLIISQSLIFVDKRIENVNRTKSGLNYFGQDVMPIPWYVPRGLQKHTE